MPVPCKQCPYCETCSPTNIGAVCKPTIEITTPAGKGKSYKPVPATDVYAQAVEQDRLFFQQLMQTMTPEEINRFCFENGFAVPEPKGKNPMLKKNAHFVRMEDAGSFRLPPEAKIVHAGMAEELRKGDFVKFCVNGDNGAKEKFWTKFVSYNDHARTVTVTVDNDLVYTEYHGLKYKDLLTIPSEFICAAMKS